MRSILIYLTFAIALILFNYKCYSQISQGGIPKSFGLIQKSVIAEPASAIMEDINLSELQAEDFYTDQIKEIPWRFGKDLFVNLNTKNSGTWDEIDGGRIWRLSVVSEGALSLSLTFNNYRLPRGATLFIYNTDRSVVLGAFTSYHNQEDRYFAISPIPGDIITLEYFEPADAEFEGELNIWRVTHGYRSIYDYVKAFGSSDDCHVNSICFQGNPIRNQIRGTALIITGGSLCSGSLINNTSNDGTPYLLTADHCYDTPGGVVVWFNWQSATCPNPMISPPYNSISGAISRARNSTSDFWLLELNHVPPPEYNVFFCGWNRTVTATMPGTVYCIHHPRGDIKKISWSNGTLTTSAYLNNTGTGTDHWRVGSWSDGTTTEAGSSGGVLLDNQYRIIGQLHGGYANCSNTQPDWYGKFSVSWTGGGANNNRLSNWLDPGNTSVLTLDGINPDYDLEILEVISPVLAYPDTGKIVPGIVILNSGSYATSDIAVSYTLNGSTVIYELPLSLLSGETDTIVFDSTEIDWGENLFIARVKTPGDNDVSNDSLKVTFNVMNCYDQTFPVTELFNDTNTLPVCWDTISIAGDKGILNVAGSATGPVVAPYEGSGMVVFYSSAAAPGSEVRLLSNVMSTLSVSGITVNFAWFHSTENPSSADSVIIEYSFDGLLWIRAGGIERFDANPGWTLYNFGLPDTTDNQHALYIGFRFRSENGANCYVDSISITGNITGPYLDFTADFTEAEMLDTVTFTETSLNASFTSWQWDFGEGAQPAIVTGEGPHKVSYTSSGRKTISLVADSLVSRTKVNYVNILPIPFIPPRDLTAILTSDKDVLLLWDMSHFSDGFETGDFSLWDSVAQGPGVPIEEDKFAYWHVSTQTPYEGSYGAIVNYGYDIDTRIVMPPLLATDTTLLSFLWLSSYYWHVFPFDHGDLFVEISEDGGATWSPVWTFGNIGEWLNMTWYETTIDFSDYSGSEILLSFHVVADDNADIVIDNVKILNASDKKIAGTRQAGPDMIIHENARSLSTMATPPKITKGVFSSYSLFRDGVEIMETSRKSYADEGVSYGFHIYYVKANYINPSGTSIPSNEVEVFINLSSLDKIDENHAVSVFPNPSNGIFNIRADKEYTVSVININGKVIESFTTGTSRSELDLRRYGRGIYMLHFRSDDESFVVKAIVVR